MGGRSAQHRRIVSKVVHFGFLLYAVSLVLVGRRGWERGDLILFGLLAVGWFILLPISRFIDEPRFSSIYAPPFDQTKMAKLKSASDALASHLLPYIIFAVLIRLTLAAWYR